MNAMKTGILPFNPGPSQIGGLGKIFQYFRIGSCYALNNACTLHCGYLACEWKLTDTAFEACLKWCARLYFDCLRKGAWPSGPIRPTTPMFPHFPPKLN